MAGLGAAERSLEAGRRVVLVEAAPTVGGLARAITVGGEPIEPYYHHIFPQDHETRELIDRLGMTDRLEWRKAPMAVMDHGRVAPVRQPARRPPLPRAVAAASGSGWRSASAYQLVRRDRRRMDATPVGVDGPRWFGRGAYRHALAAAPAGEVRRRRRRHRDGLARGADPPAGGRAQGRRRQARLPARQPRNPGDRLRRRTSRRAAWRCGPGTRATALERTARRLDRPDRDGRRRRRAAHDVGRRLPQRARSSSRLVELPPAYKAAIDAIDYRGIVCALLELDRPLSGYYWTNVTDRLGLGCVGIIEHTNFIPAERYGGRSLALPGPLRRPRRGRPGPPHPRS